MSAADVLTIRKWTLYMTIRVLYNMKKVSEWPQGCRIRVTFQCFLRLRECFCAIWRLPVKVTRVSASNSLRSTESLGLVAQKEVHVDQYWNCLVGGALSVLLSEFDADTWVTFTSNLQIAQKHSLSRREHWNVTLILHPWGHSETFFHVIKSPDCQILCSFSDFEHICRTHFTEVIKTVVLEIMKNNYKNVNFSFPSSSLFVRYLGLKST